MTPWTGVDVDLDAVRARLEAATPGPWEQETYRDGELLPDGTGGMDDYESLGSSVFALDDEGFCRLQIDCGNVRDAEFIAHARTDLPAALDEIDRLRAALTSARKEVERLTMSKQQFVDWAIHYRNLAIVLGAKPEQMLNEYDRDLAAHPDRVRDEHGSAAYLDEDSVEAWAKADAAVAARDREARARQAAEQERDEAQARAQNAEHDYDARGERLWRLATLAGHEHWEAENDACAELTVTQALAQGKAAEGAVERVRALIPNECWVLRSPASGPTCTDMVGGGTPNGAKFTEDMCCLPCRLRAALDATDTPTDSDPGCGCGRDDRAPGEEHAFEPGCDSWDTDTPTDGSEQ